MIAEIWAENARSAAIASIALDTAAQVEIIRPDRRVASGPLLRGSLRRDSGIAVHGSASGAI